MNLQRTINCLIVFSLTITFGLNSFSWADSEDDRFLQAYHQGNQAFDDKSWKEAIGFYTRALQIKPIEPDIQENLRIAKYNLYSQRGWRYQETGDFEKALYQYRQAMNFSGSKDKTLQDFIRVAQLDIYMRDGWQAYETGKWDNTIYYFEKACALYPNEVTLKENLEVVRQHRSEQTRRRIREIASIGDYHKIGSASQEIEMRDR